MNESDHVIRMGRLESQQREMVELVSRVAAQVQQLAERQTVQDGALAAIALAVDKLGQLGRLQQSSLETLARGVARHDQTLAALATFTQATALAFKQLYAGLHDLTAAIAEGSDLPAAPDPAALAIAVEEIRALEELFRRDAPKGGENV